MTALKRVIGRLEAVGIEVRERQVEVFGEVLPLVKAIAWDAQTAQVALLAVQDDISSPEGTEGDGTTEDPAGHTEQVAAAADQRDPADEAGGEAVSPEGLSSDLPPADIPQSGEAPDTEPWRQLLFAVSSLRHHLRGNSAPALATPIVFAIIDDVVQVRLRELVDQLAQNYALFTRVDLNLIAIDQIADDDALDAALAPMFPCLRRAIRDERTVAPADIDRFWSELSSEIDDAAESALVSNPAEVRDQAAAWLKDGLEDAPAMPGSLRALAPIAELVLDSFRSFGHETVRLASATIIEGGNGSGKSSLVEALELLWAGATQRIPVGTPHATYSKHLGQDGGSFRLRACTTSGDELEASSVSADPGASLRRNVLTQESMDDLASMRPDLRFQAFLAATGLRLPNLPDQLEALSRRSVEELNAVLTSIGIEPMPAINRRPLEHVRSALRANFSARLPATDDLEAAASTLINTSQGSYQSPTWRHSASLVEALAALDESASILAGDFAVGSGIETAAETVAVALATEAEVLRQRAEPLRRLVDATGQHVRMSEDAVDRDAEYEAPVPFALAARWQAHAHSVANARAEFEQAATEIADPKWRHRLEGYARALGAAVEAAELDELQKLPTGQRVHNQAVPTAVADELFDAAGFERPVVPTPGLVAAASELLRRTGDQADQLTQLAAAVDRYPGRQLGGAEAALAGAMARCELARTMRLPTSPVSRASTSLVEQMLAERLFPVVRELVEALVRFDWYFQPLELDVDGDRVWLRGLSTTSRELDIRFLLNAAERDVVAIAWFLALHLLQPQPERRVLVLDDPASGFDNVNRAGFVATLRAIVRLSRPEQLIITTHDELLAELLEEELGPVAGWPDDLVRIRCRRDGDALSIAIPREVGEFDANLEREQRILDLDPDSEQPVASGN